MLGEQGRSRLAIPISIAAIAVVTALGAIVVALRSSPPEPLGAAETPASAPATAQPQRPADGAPAPAPEANDRQRSISKSLRIPLRAAQDALKARNYPDAIAKLEAADSMHGKSPYDQHVINLFLMSAYAGVKDYAATARVVEADLNAGLLTSSETARETNSAALINYQIKAYDKAIEFGNRAIRSGFATPPIATMVAQAYYLKGDWGGAERFEEESVRRQVAAGGTPDRTSLELWMSACVKLHDSSCEIQALDKLTTYYPTPQTQRELDRLRAAR